MAHGKPAGKPVRIGVLDLQGAVSEHLDAVREAGATAVPVKRSEALSDLDGLIIPGGESTTIGRLMDEYGFMEAVPREVERGMALWGTCAGLIIMARDIRDGLPGQHLLALMDVVAVRNGFGRQIESFEADLDLPDLGEPPYPGVFIRAPYIVAAGSGVRVMGSFGDKIVAARQGRLLATAFHPELAGDARVHRYFAGMAGADR